MNADSSRPEPGSISRDLIKETLRTLEVRFLIDGDGDVITLWPDSCMCFLTAGTRSTIYVHQVHLDRRFALDNRQYLLEQINDWNRDHYWPKAFAVTDDMGEVHVHAESQFDCTAGITPELFTHTTACWIAAALQFVAWINLRA
ncbi:hypothetical protein GCM10022403_033680 [Streptomyces coacervatus]|uniref:YbjN domain-containing protein n=1 Tax=Streptomyces coacervatus TaxID=647381 RepID=A0ABP7HNV1_9ACTN|nr:YbjN domain-containing protein [Streptomyces coacervatus]MDF2272148.1 YbjN domain-containing protein [Streptomyces coacervatus]